MTSQRPLVVIVGPTAGGKTALSLALARRFKGEIVSCDSVAVYREIEIGTAKPGPIARMAITHHLIDVATLTETFTAGDYARMARAALADITQRERLPIVVGGTGLYLRALLDGLFQGPQRSEPLREKLRQRAQQRGPAYLHRILTRLDSVAAARIHANDVAKVIRAIEVCIAGRQPMTDLLQQGRDPLQGFRILRIGLDPDRARLYERINQRALEMFEHGLVEETRLLLEQYGGADTASPLGSLGYKQAVQFLRGELSLEQAIAAAQQGHRNYAKRQLTWFRREPDVLWFQGFGEEAAVEQAASSAVERFLATPQSV